MRNFTLWQTLLYSFGSLFFNFLPIFLQHRTVHLRTLAHKLLNGMTSGFVFKLANDFLVHCAVESVV